MNTATATATNARQLTTRPEQAAQRLTAEVANRKLPTWMKISRTRAELIVAFSMTILVGMNNTATGANLSSRQETYGVSYEQISLVFLANVAGYLTSCITATLILQRLGVRRALLVAAASMGTGSLILTFIPPYPLFIISLAFMGFGTGMYSTSTTTLISHSKDGTLMSLLYSCFGIGGMVSPLKNAMIDHGVPWNKNYFIPLAITSTLALVGYFVFAKYQPPNEDSPRSDIPLDTISPSSVESQRAPASSPPTTLRAKMFAVLRMRAIWVGFMLAILSFAVANTLPAWLVSFMIKDRNTPAGSSRYLLSGLWGGLALGRIVLAFVARRMSEKSFGILVLTLASSALGTVWGARSFRLDAVALAVTRFFLGPITPGIISAVAQRVPTALKSSAVSLTIGVGLIGSSMGPLLFGVVASKGGLSSPPAVLIGTSCVSALGWLLIPPNTRRND